VENIAGFSDYADGFNTDMNLMKDIPNLGVSCDANRNLFLCKSQFKEITGIGAVEEIFDVINSCAVV